MSSPITMDEISQVEKPLNQLSKKALQDENSRKKLLNVLSAQVAVLESPLEVIWRMMMEPHQSASLRTALAMGLIEALAFSDSPKTATELAAITKCDKQLIIRILRPLSAMKIVDEAGIETYASNPTTQILTVPSVGGGFKFMYDEAATSVIYMPSFLAKNKFINPQGPETCFQSAMKTDLQLFPYLMANPDHMSNFNDLMMGQRMNRTEWFEFSDVNSVLFDGMDADEDATLLLDIGGGRGHDLEAFKKKFPDAKGRLVLQELPPVIDDITELDSSIVRMKHDFFTEQPIKGARAYYMRSILHDYNDQDCQRILKHIVEAMKPGYSKVLIFEWILPDIGAPLYPALLDINMLSLFSGMERTETQWRALLDTVGLEIVKVWSIGKETEGLIEAVRRV